MTPRPPPTPHPPFYTTKTVKADLLTESTDKFLRIYPNNYLYNSHQVLYGTEYYRKIGKKKSR